MQYRHNSKENVPVILLLFILSKMERKLDGQIIVCMIFVSYIEAIVVKEIFPIVILISLVLSIGKSAKEIYLYFLF